MILKRMVHIKKFSGTPPLLNHSHSVDVSRQCLVGNVRFVPRTVCPLDGRKSGTGKGGVKTYRTLKGGELAPKVAPRGLRLLDPNLAAIFYRISVERGVFFQGLWKFKIFTPPLIFGDLTPYPGLQENARFKNGHAHVETRVLKTLGHWFHLWGGPFPFTGLFSYYLIVGFGPGTFKYQGFGVSLRI